MPKIVAAKEDWIKLGYKLFSELGENGLIVDKMSRILRCNKSSFYWHFKTKSEFINCLIDYWITVDTTYIINEINKDAGPKEKFLKLIKLTFCKDSNLDFVFYLKKYSQSNKRIQKIVDQIDADRIKFVSTLLEQMGYNKDDADSKANVFYKYLIGYHEMIRYKKQDRNYLSQVLNELNQFIKINIGNEK